MFLEPTCANRGTIFDNFDGFMSAGSLSRSKRSITTLGSHERGCAVEKEMCRTLPVAALGLRGTGFSGKRRGTSRCLGTNTQLEIISFEKCLHT